jgi:hypothetical protein
MGTNPELNAEEMKARLAESRSRSAVAGLQASKSGAEAKAWEGSGQAGGPILPEVKQQAYELYGVTPESESRAQTAFVAMNDSVGSVSGHVAGGNVFGSGNADNVKSIKLYENDLVNLEKMAKAYPEIAAQRAREDLAQLPDRPDGGWGTFSGKHGTGSALVGTVVTNPIINPIGAIANQIGKAVGSSTLKNREFIAASMNSIHDRLTKIARGEAR